MKKYFARALNSLLLVLAANAGPSVYKDAHAQCSHEFSDNADTGVWHFNEGSGDATKNSADARYGCLALIFRDSTPSSDLWINGLFGNAVEFGAGISARFEDQIYQDQIHTQTLEAHVMPRTIASYSDDIQTIYRRAGAFDFGLKDGKLVLRTYSCGNPQVFLGNRALPTDKYTYVAARFDSGKVELFFNGNLTCPRVIRREN